MGVCLYVYMYINIQDMYIEGMQTKGCKCGEKLIALSPFCHQTSNIICGQADNRITAPVATVNRHKNTMKKPFQFTSTQKNLTHSSH